MSEETTDHLAALEAAVVRHHELLSERLNPAPRWHFNGKLSADEQRMIDEGALDQYPWPVWMRRKK